MFLVHINKIVTFGYIRNQSTTLYIKTEKRNQERALCFLKDYLPFRVFSYQKGKMNNKKNFLSQGVSNHNERNIFNKHIKLHGFISI